MGLSPLSLGDKEPQDMKMCHVRTRVPGAGGSGTRPKQRTAALLEMQGSTQRSNMYII